MKANKYIYILLVFIGIASCNNHVPTISKSMEKDGIVIHISQGEKNPHSTLMALTLANSFINGDQDLLVYFDVDAINLVTNNAPVVKYPGYEDSDMLIKALYDNKVKVMVCPGCMAADSIQNNDLIQGTIIRGNMNFFSFTKGRIVSLSY
ncbi:MAG: DsrE family protein [Hyphomicrobiales bacterium]